MNFNFKIVQTQLCEINKAKQCLSLPGTEHLGSCLSLQSVVLLMLNVNSNCVSKLRPIL